MHAFKEHQFSYCFGAVPKFSLYNWPRDLDAPEFVYVTALDMANSKLVVNTILLVLKYESLSITEKVSQDIDY
jgi:hypothetical protein